MSDEIENQSKPNNTPNYQDVEDFSRKLIDFAGQQVEVLRTKYPNLSNEDVDAFFIVSFSKMVGISVQSFAAQAQVDPSEGLKLSRNAVLEGRAEYLDYHQSICGKCDAGALAAKLREKMGEDLDDDEDPIPVSTVLTGPSDPSLN